MARQIFIMLKGKDIKGILRLCEEKGGFKASVNAPGINTDENHNVYLFYDEEKSEKLGELINGETRGRFEKSEIAAACVTKNGEEGESFVMTGETGNFDWEKAKSIFYMKKQAKKGVFTAAAPDEETLRSVSDDTAKQIPLPDNLEQVYEETAGKIENIKEFPEYYIEDEKNALKPAQYAFEKNTGNEVCAACPLHVKKSEIRPFSNRYQEYVWEKTEFPGLRGCWHYITGRCFEDGKLKKTAIGVPGEYALKPPSWLYGFDTYEFADEGEARGYWMLFEEAPNSTA